MILSTEKYRQIAEMTVQTRHQKLVARCEATEMEMALRDALATIEQQAIRHKKKSTTIKRHPKADVKGAKPEAAASARGRRRRGEGGDEEQRRAQGGADAGALLPVALAAGGAARCALDRWGCAASDVAGRGGKEAAFRDRDVFVFRDHGGQAMVLHRKRDGKMELIEVP